MLYNWQQHNWPNFQYDLTPDIENVILTFSMEAGQISGMLKAIPKEIELNSMIDTMIIEAIKNSEIEGEHLNRNDVASSIINNLGLKERVTIRDRNAEAMGKLMVDVRNTYSVPLSEDILLEWHKVLFMPSKKINAGAWRKSKKPMQILSGTIGKENIHFQAPPSSKVPGEMTSFVEWFNETAPGGRKEISKAPLRAAIAHLYFESIHPFEDGNGRIGRIIAEKVLSQAMGRPALLSLSQVIEADKKNYYQALETAQQSNNITEWVRYFANTVLQAQIQARRMIDFTLQKTKFFDHYHNQLNERQLKAILRMFDEGIDGFKGGMTAKKYMSLAGTSKATATRDLLELFGTGAFVRSGDARNLHYFLNLEFYKENSSNFEMTGMKERNINNAKLILSGAIKEKRRVKFYYESERSGKKGWRIVDPYIIGVKRNGNVFLAALPEQELSKPITERQLGHFSLSKIDILKLQLLKETYNEPSVPRKYITNTPTIEVICRFLYPDEKSQKIIEKLNTSLDILTTTEKYGKEVIMAIWMDLQSYEGSKNAGITGYKLLKDGIILEFKSKDLYLYDYSKPGKEDVEQMKILAERGEGLTTYVNQHVRSNYKKKLNKKASHC